MGGITMSQTRYIISDASKKIDVEPHVLRYWEEELQLEIKRNEMGHRYYREEDLEQLKGIKQLKENGFQLKAIKIVLPEMKRVLQLDEENLERLRDELNDKVLSLEGGTGIITREKTVSNSKLMEEKMGQFQTIMTGMFSNVLKEQSKVITKAVSEEVTNSVIKEMDYRMRLKEEREEAHYKKLDEVLHAYRESKKEAAAAVEKKKKKKFVIF